MIAVEMFTLLQGIAGVNAFGATCQSALETGWWTSKLWREAHNGGGLKASKSWINAGKPFIPIQSLEWDGKQTVQRLSKFRAYTTPEEFVQDYAEKIRTLYPSSASQADNFWGYFAGLYRGKWGAWATDPKYFKKLGGMAVALAPELLGKEWVARFYRAFELARNRGTLAGWQVEIVEEILKGLAE